LLHGLSDPDAIAALARALNAPHEVSAAAHLPAPVARRSAVVRAQGPVTAVRIEGHGPSVAFRQAALSALFDNATTLDHQATEALWAEIAAVGALLPPAGRCIWRICPPPSAAPAMFDNICAQFATPEAFYDWGGGLLWLSLDAAAVGPDAGAAILRVATARIGGHATLVVAPDATRAAVPVFEPEADALAALTRRVKAGFDPLHILNPGRMRQGE
jgi:glycolate oxidase FAD binding subunit